MHQVEFAALKYYNNLVSEECLYIGMLFHNLNTGKCDFKYISNFKRFQLFDDEADVDFVKAYLLGIKQQIESYNNIGNAEFTLSSYIKIYVNEFKFTKITTIDVEEDENYVDNLTKVYLKFDFTMNKRLTQSDEKRYIRKILSSSKATFSKPKISGLYDENVSFDYIIGDVAIKLFSFKGKDATKLVPAAKQWAFSAEELKNRYKIYFLYDEDIGLQQVKVVMKILGKHAKVYRIQDGLNYVLKDIS